MIPDRPIGVQIPKTACPHCGVKMDGATQINDKHKFPEPGDVAFCFECGGWCQFDKDLHRALPDKKALKWILRNPDCVQLKVSWLLMKAIADYTDDAPAG